jgi:hypothetical protein
MLRFISLMILAYRNAPTLKFSCEVRKRLDSAAQFSLILGNSYERIISKGHLTLDISNKNVFNYNTFLLCPQRI